MTATKTCNNVSVSTIHRVDKTFNETGCLSGTLAQDRKRKRTFVTAENMQLVTEEIFRSPDIPKSHRRLSDTLDISASSLYRILKELNLKPYMDLMEWNDSPRS